MVYVRYNLFIACIDTLLKDSPININKTLFPILLFQKGNKINCIYSGHNRRSSKALFSTYKIIAKDKSQHNPRVGEETHKGGGNVQGLK